MLNPSWTHTLLSNFCREGSNFWAARGGRCLLVAPEHLRPAEHLEVSEALRVRIALDDVKRLVKNEDLGLLEVEEPAEIDLEAEDEVMLPELPSGRSNSNQLPAGARSSTTSPSTSRGQGPGCPSSENRKGQASKPPAPGTFMGSTTCTWLEYMLNAIPSRSGVISAEIRNVIKPIWNCHDNNGYLTHNHSYTQPAIHCLSATYT